jgi:hypothetical protein
MSEVAFPLCRCWGIARRLENTHCGSEPINPEDYSRRALAGSATGAKWTLLHALRQRHHEDPTTPSRLHRAEHSLEALMRRLCSQPGTYWKWPHRSASPQRPRLKHLRGLPRVRCAPLRFRFRYIPCRLERPDTCASASSSSPGTSSRGCDSAWPRLLGRPCAGSVMRS